MSYYYPFGFTNRATSSSFTTTSVTASFSASVSARVVTSSFATNVIYPGQTGDSGSSYSTPDCPPNSIECPSLLGYVYPTYAKVCLDLGDGCISGTPQCPDSIPLCPSFTTSTTTTSTSTTSTSTTTTSTSTSTTTTAAPTTTTTTSTTTTTTTAAPTTTTTTSTTTTTTTAAPTTTSTTTTVAPTTTSTTTTTTAAPTTTSTTTSTTSTSTTSTSTSTTSTSTTSTTTNNCVFQYDVSGPEASFGAACALPDSADVSVYYNGTGYYSNGICTTLITDGFYKRDVDDYWVQFSSGLLVAGPTDCNATTTTTTTTGAVGTCYTAVAGGGTSQTVYWTDPTLGPQTTTIPGGNKINICSNTVPYESPAADVLFYDCGTSCTTAVTCTDCEGATTTTTTSTTTTSTSTTTTTTTLPPVITSVAITDTQTSSGNAPSPCQANPEIRHTTSVLLKDQYGNNIGNGATPINVVIRYTDNYSNTSDVTVTISAFQNAGIASTYEYAQSTYNDNGITCVNETSTITCVVSITGGLGDGGFGMCSSTTTTTTSAPTTTSTSTTTTSNCIFQYDVSGPEASSTLACGLPDSGDVSVYYNGTTYYSNAICTTIITDGFYKRDVDDYWVEFSSGLLVGGPTDCNATTTTTTSTTSTTTSTTTTSTSTTTTTTTAAPIPTSVDISDSYTSTTNAPSPCGAFNQDSNTTSVTLKDQYGNNITNGITPINVVVRYTDSFNNTTDQTITIAAFQLAGTASTYGPYVQSTYNDQGAGCVQETNTLTCVVSVSGGLTATGLTSC